MSEQIEVPGRGDVYHKGHIDEIIVEGPFEEIGFGPLTLPARPKDTGPEVSQDSLINRHAL